MSNFDVFLDNLINRGLEYLGKFYGPYRAEVARVDDPEQRGRIQVRCPRVGHAKSLEVWVDPAFAGAGADRGLFWPPEVGDTVWVAFTNGDPSRPCMYMGAWHGTEDVPDEFQYSQKTVRVPLGPTQTRPVPERRGFITRKGHRLVLSDVAGQEELELSWHKAAATDPAQTADNRGTRDQTADRSLGETTTLKVDSKGDVYLTTHKGSSITMKAGPETIEIKDSQGNSVTVSGGKITLHASALIELDASQVTLSTGADTPAVRGIDLMNYLTSHVHPTAWGPSGPPPPPPPSILSSQVKLK